jgi:hypothetical protein
LIYVYVYVYRRYGFLKSRPMRPREFDAFLVGLYGVRSSRGDYSREKCVDHTAARKNSHFIREFSVAVCVTCQQVCHPELIRSHFKSKKKMTLGWVVNGGRRHAGLQGDLIPRGYWVE